MMSRPGGQMQLPNQVPAWQYVIVYSRDPVQLRIPMTGRVVGGDTYRPCLGRPESGRITQVEQRPVSGRGHAANWAQSKAEGLQRLNVAKFARAT